MRKPNGSLALLDGEFGRLGMLGYDPAYFAIQTFCLFNRGELSAIMLSEAWSAWQTNYPEDNFDKAILAPLAYRLVANLNDVPTKQNADVRKRTLALKQLVLSNDLQTVIDGLHKTP